jgi:anaerobic magnesium-protoporphyrin IX monomethyl ester cyclase
VPLRGKLRVALLGHNSDWEAFTYGYGRARLATYARQEGVPADVVHLDRRMSDGEEDDVRLLVAERPDVVGLSVYLWSAGRVARLVAALRRALPEALLVVGGPSVLGLDAVAGPGTPRPDYAVVGEGEVALARLLRARQQGRLAAEEAEIAGLAAWRDGAFVRFAAARPLRALDLLGSPYLAGLARPSAGVLYWETARGCPFGCAFCVLSQRPRGVRPFSLPFLEGELRWALDAGCREVNVCDAALNYDSERLDAVTAMIRRVDPARRLAFAFALHSDPLDEGQLRSLERLRISGAAVGLNSLTPATFAGVRRRIDRERFAAAIALLSRVVRPEVNVIVGLPGETLAEFERTVEFCAGLPATIRFFDLRVIPETTYFVEAEQHGLVYDPGDEMRVVRAASYTAEDLAEMRRLAAALGGPIDDHGPRNPGGGGAAVP